MKVKIKEILFNLGAEICGVAGIDLFGAAPNSFWKEEQTITRMGERLNVTGGR